MDDTDNKKGDSKPSTDTSTGLQYQSTPTGDIEVLITADPNNTMISLVPPECPAKLPANVACVIDVSGSMGTDATLKNDSGNMERTGFSVLDIVKHAALTIIENLGDQDRFSLISYHSSAKVELPLTKMDGPGKTAAKTALGKLEPRSTTNLYDGMIKGLDSLRDSNDANANSVLFLLTDGLPNVVPPRGHIPMLKRYKDEHGLPGTIHTFGFGYNLDSKLLRDLAIEGNGTYSFIPDSSLVGTVFINSLSNVLVNKGKNVVLKIEAENGTTFPNTSIVGYPHTTPTWGIEIDIGSIGHGQPIDIVIPIKFADNLAPDTEYLTATISYQDTLSKSKITNTSSGTIVSAEPNSAITTHSYRWKTVLVIGQAMDYMLATQHKDATTLVKGHIEELKHCPVKSDPFIVDLLKDLESQIFPAFSRKDWYKRWGKHYLPSFSIAQALQLCNNFKDNSVQHFAGSLFSKVRDHADKVFLNLKPPKPSNVPSGRGGRGYSGAPGGAGAAPVRMSAFYNSNAPCFSGTSIVHLANGSTKMVQDIRKGDVLSSSVKSGNPAIVKCVVKTHCPQSTIELVTLDSGLVVTPWHPVRINNQWSYPNTLAPIQNLHCPAVYSFVLDSQHTMLINNTECVTMGHSFTDDPVVSHPYYGSNKVIQDLQAMNGWVQGLVELETGCALRNPETGLVSKLVQVQK